MKSSEAPSETLRVGILATDNVLDDYRSSFGDYPEMFAALLERAAAARSPQLSIRLETYDARDGLPELDACEAYLVTGSRQSVYDGDPWITRLAAFLGEAMGIGRRVIGICFGHQLLAHFFGGRTEAAEVGWAVGVQRAELRATFPWMQPPLESFSLLASHKDQVSRLPEGAVLFAGSSFCPVGGFVMDDRALALQGHPEFVKDYAGALMERRRELLGEDTYQAGLASLARDTHEDAIAAWILNFLTAPGDTGARTAGCEE